MRQTRFVPLAALALLAVAAACGGGGTSADPSGGTTGGGAGGVGPETAVLFCDQMYTSFVDRYAACLRAPTAYVTHNVDKTKLCALPAAAITAGHATYDRAAAGRCLDFYATATCTDLQAVRDETIDVPDCRVAVKGTLGVNVACVSDAECASGSCGANQSNYCSGACAYARKAGDVCANDRECSGGTFCYKGDVYPKGTCQPQTNRPGEGGSCLYVGCLPGFYCTNSPDYVCKAKLESGACASVRQAAPGYACVYNVIEPLVAVGAVCNTDFECGPGAECSTVCTQLPVVGEKCALARGAWQCLGGTCNVVSLTDADCVEYYPDTCGTDWDCESKGYCFGGCKSFCVRP